MRPWCRERALALREALAGDWLWVATDAPAAPHCTPQALQTLLGREFRHAVFDAQLGFDASAFAALSGTLRAGSWLVLLTPPYSAWESRPDTDSLRWSDCPQPVATPHFIQHLKRVMARDEQTLHWQQSQPFSWPRFPARPHWQPATGERSLSRPRFCGTCCECRPAWPPLRRREVGGNRRWPGS
ncbi:ATP-dependent acetyltransferase [Citrobacter koseri]|uniref:ATP-dependent acetyltransferase n=1 Tax=Citrobacter koseri TaxID=545 RepID=A0A447UIX3_CITKO|nr:ATP-dependent acetyltransferase [Citrobacter koseri]